MRADGNRKRTEIPPSSPPLAGASRRTILQGQLSAQWLCVLPLLETCVSVLALCQGRKGEKVCFSRSVNKTSSSRSLEFQLECPGVWQCLSRMPEARSGLPGDLTPGVKNTPKGRQLPGAGRLPELIRNFLFYSDFSWPVTLPKKAGPSGCNEKTEMKAANEM